MVKITL